MKITPRHIGALTTTLALIGGSITFMQPTKAEMSKTETTIQQGSQMFEKTALNDKVGTTSWVEESLTIEAPVAQSDPLPIPGVI